MEIRKAKNSEIKQIKELVDKFEEMDVIKETFPETYYRRILQKGILLVAIENMELVGVCFGTYNTKEKWADLLGLVVREKFRKMFGRDITVPANQQILNQGSDDCRHSHIYYVKVLPQNHSL